MANSAPVVLASDQASIPVTVSGVSTAAKQDTIIGHVDGIETVLGTMDTDTGAIATSVASLDTKAPALGQALAAGSVPVVLTAAQVTTLTPPAAITGYATSAKQDTIIGHVDGIEASLTTVAGAVAGTEMQVDIVTSALPTGAATSAKQDTIIGHVDGIEASLTTVAGAVSGTEMQVDIVGSLPAGTAAIGKLAANSGVDIGDVDVTTVGTITPGTAASSLGKAENAAHSSGDVGVMALSVSNENSTAFGAASAGYTPSAVNRYGHQYVTAVPPSHISSNGTPITATTTSVIAAPSAGNHLRIMRIHISNGGATATWVGVRDGAAGTRHYNTYLVQGATISINLNDSGPLDLTTATRLDIFLSAAGSCEYEIDYLTVVD